MIVDWRPVKGYEGYYLASNTGEIQRICQRVLTSKGHYQTCPAKILRKYKGTVSLSTNGIVTSYRVDKLVATAFIPNPNNYEYVSHIDGDTTNNSVDNLCWGPILSNINEDEWKDIPGYEGYYQASIHGGIRSVDRVISYERDGKTVYATRQSTELNYVVNTDGYRCLLLSINGRVENKSIHRLVAQTFLPNPENKPQVNHKDGNKQNNELTNLEWATSIENMCHAKSMQLWNPESCGDASRKATGKPVRCITTGVEYLSISQAAKECNMDDQSIKDSIVLNRHRKGLLFEYIINR